VAALLAPIAALVDPAPELEVSPVDGVDHEVPDATRPPDALGSLLAFAPHRDEAIVASVVRRDPEQVQLPGDPDAAPAIEAEPLVDPAHEASRRQILPVDRLVGHEARRVPLASDAIAEGDDPTAVAALPGRPLHPSCGELQELSPAIRGDDCLDTVAKFVRLALDDADQPDAEVVESSADDEEVDLVAAETVELVDVDLVDPGRGSRPHEPAPGGPLGEGDRPRHPFIDETFDELNVRFAGE
jgi:hypothetical protein